MENLEENQIAANTELQASCSGPGSNYLLKTKAEELAKDAGGKALEWLSSGFLNAKVIAE